MGLAGVASRFPCILDWSSDSAIPRRKMYPPPLKLLPLLQTFNTLGTLYRLIQRHGMSDFPIR